MLSVFGLVHGDRKTDRHAYLTRAHAHLTLACAGARTASHAHMSDHTEAEHERENDENVSE